MKVRVFLLAHSLSRSTQFLVSVSWVILWKEFRIIVDNFFLLHTITIEFMYQVSLCTMMIAEFRKQRVTHLIINLSLIFFSMKILCLQNVVNYLARAILTCDKPDNARVSTLANLWWKFEEKNLSEFWYLFGWILRLSWKSWREKVDRDPRLIFFQNLTEFSWFH